MLYPEDERYLVDGESHITHYDVADHIPSPRSGDRADERSGEAGDV